jgi:hypothetical protein
MRTSATSAVAPPAMSMILLSFTPISLAPARAGAIARSYLVAPDSVQLGTFLDLARTERGQRKKTYDRWQIAAATCRRI